jgi:hypothetical protein
MLGIVMLYVGPAKSPISCSPDEGLVKMTVSGVLEVTDLSVRAALSRFEVEGMMPDMLNPAPWSGKTFSS